MSTSAQSTAQAAPITPLQFVESLGVGRVIHDSGSSFLEHLTGVQTVLKGWGEKEDLCNVGLFHSIYGSELFQDFSLSLDQRDVVRQLIGDYAEELVYDFCTMDLGSLDAALDQAPSQHFLLQRAQHGSRKLPMTDQQFHDMLVVQMADWLEQVERWAQKPEEKMGWVPGDAWGHRRTGYRKMAEMLGGKYLAAYEAVYAREPGWTRSIVHDVVPEVKHQGSAIRVG